MSKTTKKLKNTSAKAVETTPVSVTPIATSQKAEKTIVAPPTTQKPVTPRVNQVSLELVKPGAQTVFVAGSFNEWKPETTPLVSTGNGRWVGDLAVKPGRHEYLFVVDGQWLPDPNAKETVQNPYGGTNSVLRVSG